MQNAPDGFYRNLIRMTTDMNGSIVYLVRASDQNDGVRSDAAMLINLVRPNSVVIDLCSRERHLMLTKNNQGLISSIREHGFCQGVFEKFVAYLLSDDNHFIPTGDFRSAISEARRFNCRHIILGDRSIYITVCRLMSKLGWIKCIKIFARFYRRAAYSYLRGGEQIGSIRNYDVLVNLVAELFRDYPEVNEVLIDERSKCLTYILQKRAGFQLFPTYSRVKSTPRSVIGVVALCDIPGIQKYWGTVTRKDYEQLSNLLPPSKSTKLIKLIVKASIYGLLLWGVSQTPDEVKPILVTKLILSMF